ncbi:Protein of unknown function [Propionibacterium freudenreichii]|nr:Protein of unknown function [Propionibacterium freudenreichii]CEI50185.1 Protein of unknown function [Propionibacterium freudenreichii]
MSTQRWSRANKSCRAAAADPAGAASPCQETPISRRAAGWSIGTSTTSSEGWMAGGRMATPRPAEARPRNVWMSSPSKAKVRLIPASRRSSSTIVRSP